MHPLSKFCVLSGVSRPKHKKRYSVTSKFLKMFTLCILAWSAHSGSGEIKRTSVIRAHSPVACQLAPDRRRLLGTHLIPVSCDLAPFSRGGNGTRIRLRLENRFSCGTKCRARYYCTIQGVRSMITLNRSLHEVTCQDTALQALPCVLRQISSRSRTGRGKSCEGEWGRGEFFISFPPSPSPFSAPAPSLRSFFLTPTSPTCAWLIVCFFTESDR